MTARRMRILRIRRAVAVVAVALFVALFAGIYVQMAAGRDPALGTTTTSSTGDDSTSTQRLPSPAPVTTSQS
jgi:hypothetical protein